MSLSQTVTTMTSQTYGHEDGSLWTSIYALFKGPHSACENAIFMDLDCYHSYYFPSGDNVSNFLATD